MIQQQWAIFCLLQELFLGGTSYNGTSNMQCFLRFNKNQPQGGFNDMTKMNQIKLFLFNKKKQYLMIRA